MKTLTTILIGAASLVATSVPAAAAITTLDFSGAICGPAGNVACSNSSRIGQNYGDSASVDVSYRSILTGTNTTFDQFLNFWSSNYGDLAGVVWGGFNSTATFNEILLTPVAGFEVSLVGFDAGCYLNRASCQSLNYDIRSVGGSAIAIGSTPTLFPSHATLAVNSSYYNDGIVLRWGPDGYDTGLDNIRFDVRAIAAPGAVPEPAAWAMMIAGFGLTGAAMRRRNLAIVTA